MGGGCTRKLICATVGFSLLLISSGAAANTVEEQNILGSGDLPETFDLREEGGVTSVKHQGHDGVCWAFSAIGGIESALKYDTGTERNFSENHMRHSLSSDEGNELGFNRAYDEGGFHRMATAYFARQSGPVDESDDPYEHGSGSSSRPPSENEGIELQKQVHEAVWIPDPGQGLSEEEHTDLIKEFVMEYGAVKTSMRWMAAYSDYKNLEENAFYYHGQDEANHAVLIVGWDDNFDRSKFKEDPGSDGAFTSRQQKQQMV